MLLESRAPICILLRGRIFDSDKFVTQVPSQERRSWVVFVESSEFRYVGDFAAETLTEVFRTFASDFGVDDGVVHHLRGHHTPFSRVLVLRMSFLQGPVGVLRVDVLSSLVKSFAEAVVDASAKAGLFKDFRLDVGILLI